jgi:L-lactate dehydrogenase complex protein LldG
VLAELRRSAPVPVPLPALDTGQPEGGPEELRRWLEAAGAQVERVASEGELAACLAGYAPFESAQRIVSTLPGIPGAEHPTPPSDDPHGYADVDLAIARGEFAVAENGAVWVSDAEVPHRALYFLAQHLVLVVPAGDIVGDLHAAYARIQRAGEPIGARPWRGFIAGPSKTADIEQALVIGAHGPRSLLVALVG